MQFVEHVADLVGNTPLVRLGPVAADIEATVLAKIGRASCRERV